MGKHRKLCKIIVYLLIFALSAAVIYALVDIPSFTAEMAFRRKEKCNMVGPAEIVATLDFSHSSYDHIMIGKSEFGYTFYEYRDASLDNGKMTYIPKQEGATLYCTYHMYGSSAYSADWLPIFAFVDHSAAVSARLTLTTIQNGETAHYPLEAKKSPEGYFLFSWKTQELRAQDFWLVQQLIANQYREYVLEGTAQATLALYNAKGELIGTYEFTK